MHKHQTLTTASLAFLLLLAGWAAAQLPSPSVPAPSPAQQRQTLVNDLWKNGYTCLKPEYQPDFQTVQRSVATPEAIRHSMVREQQIMTDSQKALKVSQIADSHWTFLGKALDGMMGILLSAGSGRDTEVMVAEKMLSGQGFIDQANGMIACTQFRQQKLKEIAELDAVAAQRAKPLHFPKPPPQGPVMRTHPAAF